LKLFIHAAICATMVLVTNGCREERRNSRTDTSKEDTTTDISSPDSNDEDDTTSPDASQDNDNSDSTATNGCAAANLGACDYPEENLTFTEREGFSVTDPMSGRVLPLLARIPEGEGPFPVVIWSHGGGANNGGHRLGKEWGEAFASNGYVVIHIAHVMPTVETSEKVCDYASIPADECVSEGDEDATGLLALFKTVDVAAVVDKLEGLSQASVADGGPALDLDRIAVAGWSGGARAPSILAGTVIETTENGDRLDEYDSRVKAVIMSSPAGPPFGGYFDTGTENSWQTVKSPILWLTGANDVKPLKQELTGPIRRHGFAKLPEDGTHWLIYSNLEVGVGGHGTYNLEDAESEDDRLSRLSRALRSTAIAYLDAMLNDDAAAKNWMASQNAKILAGDIDWENR